MILFKRILILHVYPYLMSVVCLRSFFAFESVIDRTHKMTKTTVKFLHNPESSEAGIPSRG
jgi:hypothetical protein